MHRPANPKAVRSRGLTPSGTGPKTQGKGSRQCVVCRRVMGREALLQLAGPLQKLGSARKSARRQYACIRASCLKTALGADTLRDRSLAGLAAERILGLLGLARRQGELTVGAQALVSKSIGAGDVAFVASDCAPRTKQSLARAVSSPNLHAVFTQKELARATGTTSAVAVSIRSGRIAMQAVYWLRVWYEAQALGPRRPAEDAEPAAKSTRVYAHNTQRLSSETSTD